MADSHMRPQLDHLAGAFNWQPFTSAELPPTLAHELNGILKPLYVATLELHRTVYRYELLAALGRDWGFIRKVDGTTAAPALNTIKGCIFTTIITSLCGFFDDSPDAVNLRAILNRVVRPKYLDRFQEFHHQANAGFDTIGQRERLVRLQRRLRRGETGKALARLHDLRNQVVAHLVTEPAFDDGWPVIADMTIVLAAVANIVISLVRFAIAGRGVRPLLGRLDAQKQARAMSQAIRPSAIGRRGSVRLI
jgi:hypothetical protein